MIGINNVTKKYGNLMVIDRLNLKGFIAPLTIKQLNYIKNNKSIKK